MKPARSDPPECADDQTGKDQTNGYRFSKPDPREK